MCESAKGMRKADYLFSTRVLIRLKANIETEKSVD